MPDRIAAWTHIFPKAYFARLQTMALAARPLKPFDAEGGSYLVRETIGALDALELPSSVRHKIHAGNISALINRGRD
jgi:hypothetical protein